MPDLRTALKEVPLLAGPGDRDLESLAAQMQERTDEAGRDVTLVKPLRDAQAHAG